MSERIPAATARMLVFDHLAKVARDGVIETRCINVADETKLTFDQAKTALRALVDGGVLKRLRRGNFMVQTRYRIVGSPVRDDVVAMPVVKAAPKPRIVEAARIEPVRFAFASPPRPDVVRRVAPRRYPVPPGGFTMLRGVP